MAGRLDGKVALVTGGASGIGAATCRLYAQEGARVAVADINDNLGHEVSKDSGEGLYVHLDTADEKEWAAAVQQTQDRFGRLDILVNAAGVSGRIPGTKSAPRIEDQELLIILRSLILPHERNLSDSHVLLRFMHNC